MKVRAKTSRWGPESLTFRSRTPPGVRLSDLEQHFALFRANTVGHDLTFGTPYGQQRLVYADWTASGRLYRPIEETLLRRFGPYVGNTHSESSVTGSAMTIAYHEAHARLKRHVNAGPDDLVITNGSGMTGAVNKLQRILGLKAPEGLRHFVTLPEADRPVVFVTHLEHHSNHTSWYESIADVVVVPPDDDGVVSLDALAAQLHEYRDRPMKIGAFSACSNVTGVFTPYHEMARLMRRAGGISLIDFAASAPYVSIDMHPAGDPEAALDAVLFSPHKFLGGPGSSGVMIFNRALYHNTVPDEAGGGTVAWTNPWGQYAFHDDIEAREDAGTPGFLQTIKAALAVDLKIAMGVDTMCGARRRSSPTRWTGCRRSLACTCSPLACGIAWRCSRSGPRGCTTIWSCDCSTTGSACRRAEGVHARAPMGTSCCMWTRRGRRRSLTGSIAATFLRSRAGCASHSTRVRRWPTSIGRWTRSRR